MKRKILIAGIIIFIGKVPFANGVIINKSEIGSYLNLMESTVNVSIESQVANTVTTQVFKNKTIVCRLIINAN